MGKVVTIPKDRNPFIVIVNGVEYKYPAGATIEVPDSVADVIEKYEGAKPKPDPTPTPGGGTGGSVQTDWNQKDETEPDFLKNKPFGDVAVTLIEEQTVTPVPDDMTMVQSTKAPSFGSVVQVVFNGTLFECDVTNVEGMPTVGNMAIFGEPNDTGEPFIIAWADNETAMCIITDTSADFTIKATGSITSKLAPKYVEACTFFYAPSMDTDSPNYLYKNPTFSVAVTMKDVADAISIGPVLISFSGVITFVPSMIVNANNYYVLIGFNDKAQTVQFFSSEYTPQ